MATSPTTDAAFTARDFAIGKLSNNKAQMDMRLGRQTVDLDKHPRGYQEKLFLGLTNYDKTGKTPSRYAKHTLDGPTFRMLAHIILQGTFPEAIRTHLFGPDPISKVVTDPPNPQGTMYQWKEFKGNSNKEGQVISRIMGLEWNATPDHRYPWTIKFSEGPGKKSASGAVMPSGPATTMVYMQLSAVQIYQWCQLGLEALQALTTIELGRSPLGSRRF